MASMYVPEPERMAPLLGVIAKEIAERSLAVFYLEAASGRGGATGEASLAAHRRELRRAHGELERLGWKRDATCPLRFLYPSADGSRREWHPEGTSFFAALDFDAPGKVA